MAAVKEVSVETKLKALYTLQLTDSKLDEIEVLKGELPMEVSDLEDELAGLEMRVGNLEVDIKEIKKSVSEKK